MRRLVAKLPPEVQQATYQTMWGPSEFHVTGTLKDWGITDRLGEIRVSTLILAGRYDHVTPILAEAMHHGTIA